MTTMTCCSWKVVQFRLIALTPPLRSISFKPAHPQGFNSSLNVAIQLQFSASEMFVPVHLETSGLPSTPDEIHMRSRVNVCWCDLKHLTRSSVFSRPPMCRHDLVMEENAEVTFKPLSCDESHL